MPTAERAWTLGGYQAARIATEHRQPWVIGEIHPGLSESVSA
jgi:hypothetical protein